MKNIQGARLYLEVVEGWLPGMQYEQDDLNRNQMNIRRAWQIFPYRRTPAEREAARDLCLRCRTSHTRCGGTVSTIPQLALIDRLSIERRRGADAIRVRRILAE